MTSAITFLLLLTLTGSPAATLACVAACDSAAADMEATDTGMPMMEMPGSHHVGDVMETCGNLMLVIPYVRNEVRPTISPAAIAATLPPMPFVSVLLQVTSRVAAPDGVPRRSAPALRVALRL